MFFKKHSQGAEGWRAAAHQPAGSGSENRTPSASRCSRTALHARGLDGQESKGTASSKFSREKVPRRWGPVRRIFKGLRRSPAPQGHGPDVPHVPSADAGAACCSPPPRGRGRLCSRKPPSSFGTHLGIPPGRAGG